ncbi:pantoate--beta-alanine ligase [Fibrobacter sp. UWCM]|jgi:pantoate--beta-alanine ligase|uniref:pantoate--beta-alanine ligase n=1 Tax=unclassified Fibrobacter TaxID=2634177 RepID=UPI000910A193|nr:MULTISPECIES: pantoate--beta-alanine ligase [unclassified Fibrobacter]MBO6135540.1 pantoate--beta-alanine ligase [Fibrobacter sp.]MBR2306369.1 pantoate--beta-alanine ligase [Fibrobacter sp.]MBR4008936.1 pantoate--beta-alanine ligase [Fibrobacter sp.]SHG56745.1 pantoate--beta-alanine ligase [Fibrobacter sp. UWCM]
MQIIKSIESLRETLKPFQKEGKKVGLVPTMGALHDGHGALIKASVKDCDITVVSVFLNPIQFGRNEDLDKYPKRLEADANFAASLGADYVFAPSVAEMYPNGDPLTMVRDESLECLYCGAYRPGHFRGVLTVVSKLFLISKANHAYFGEKDYQQLFLIERMVKDLNFDIEIHRVPIVRESTGLAMSSRNEYLSVDERKQALAISRGLNEAKEAYLAGERGVSKLRDIVVKSIVLSRGQVQFVEIVNQNDLQKYSGVLKPTDKVVVLVAAFFGKTRLIDNIEFN